MNMYLSTNDVHSVTSHCNLGVCIRMLYATLCLHFGMLLLMVTQVSIVGTNEVYFDELQTLYDIYTPFVVFLLSNITKGVLKPLITEHVDTAYYNHGMDIISWLNGSLPKLSMAYFTSIPILLPFIGLTQLIQHLTMCCISGLTPGELRSHITGATGYSQGVISAVVITASTTFKSFTLYVTKAVQWLFFCGLRGQEVFSVLSQEPSIVQDSIEGGGGSPSPMLAITGLALKDLEPHIKKTNTYVPDNLQLHISLHNGDMP